MKSLRCQQDTPRTLFSESLNLLFKWKVDVDLGVRLLRPYLPDGTPITTSIEEKQLREEEKQLREEEKQLREEEKQLREEAQQQHEKEQQLRKIAEAKVEEQAAELEKLRQQLGK